MLDLHSEKLISLAQAAKLIPPGPSGKPTHIATLYRWVLNGLGGVRLDAVRMGGRWLTSREALQRFADRLTPGADRGQLMPALPGSYVKSDEEEQTLTRLGI